MKYRTLGHSELKVSCIGLGGGNFGGPTTEQAARRLLDGARHYGINFLDTADAYKAGESERIIGRYLSLQRCRDEFIVATKVGSRKSTPEGVLSGSREHIMKACDLSLQRLQTDHIDLYQLHRPDFETPPEETVGALAELRAQGKIRYAGTSTFPSWLIIEMLAQREYEAPSWLISEQPPYNLLDRKIESDLVPAAQLNRIGLIAWSSLGGGVLTGKYAAGRVPEDSRLARQGSASRFGVRVTPAAIRATERVREIAQELELSCAQLALLWCFEQPTIATALVGPRQVEQLDELAKIGDATLAISTRDRLDEISPPGHAISDFHNSAGWSG